MMHQHATAKQQRGFSLIEMIVAIGLFAVVVTMSVGALLVLVAGSQNRQATQDIMTNLAFALDSMTREIRTGYDYVCLTSNTSAGIAAAFADQEESSFPGPTSCPNGAPVDTSKNSGLSFVEGGQSITGDAATRIAYFFDLDEGTIYRRVGAADPERLLSTGIRLTKAEFVVTDAAETTSGNLRQPTVTIFIEAEDRTDPAATPTRLQTTVTQRILDL